MHKTLIPARGTVEFIVYSLSDPEPDILIDGPSEWSRPVVGLVEKDWATDADDDRLLRDLQYEPVVVDEIGLLYPVYDYLDQVMGGLHWDHSSHFYRPHTDGPVGDAPRICDLSKIRPLTAAD
jgi:hypothetical protein